MPKPPAKQRADSLLLQQGHADSLAKAQALIMAGVVFAATRRIDKAADLLAADTLLHIKNKGHDFVSRGALKLQGALDHFALSPNGLIGLDIGASTGGFTELLLRRGAHHVYAVDVGTNQLDWKLRSDPRVTALEQCDARSLTTTLIPQSPQLITADISFASLIRVMPAALKLAAPDAITILLIKPQFELPRAQVPDGGIVKDTAAQAAICASVHQWLEQDMGWQILGMIPSPITGQDGNQEFLIAARNTALSNFDAPLLDLDKGSKP